MDEEIELLDLDMEMNIKRINLEDELAIYKNVFRMDDVNLEKVILPVQDLIDPAIIRMRDYHDSVVEAVAEIRRREAEDVRVTEANQLKDSLMQSGLDSATSDVAWLASYYSNEE